MRKAKGLRVRLPLPSLTVATPVAATPVAATLEPFADLVADEVNVKSVHFTTDLGSYCEQVLTVVPRVLGPRVGGQVQQVIRAVKAGDWTLVDGAPVAAGITLAEGEYELRLVAAEADRSAPLPGGGVVVLDTTLTSALLAEGLARDVVRVVQQTRRDAGLDISDRIVATIAAPAEVARAVEAYRDFVARGVLADSVRLTDPGERVDGFAGEAGDGERITVLVSRA